jgi:hypothetical protein
VRFNLIATHVHAEEVRQRLGEGPGAHFTVGDYYEGDTVTHQRRVAVPPPDLHVTWTEGTPPG